MGAGGGEVTVVQFEGRGGQPTARYAFVDREALMRALHVGEQASDMVRFLRDLGFKTPNSTTIERICYRGHLMKSDTALRWLRAFRRYADENNIVVEGNPFAPEVALTDFGYRVVGLGEAIRRISGQLVNSEVNPVSDLALASNLSPEVIVNMSQGRCVLVPRQVAEQVAQAASVVLKLSDRLSVEQQRINDNYFKPIGAAKVENGADAFRCHDTAAIRRSLLNRIGKLGRAA
jgi:hypothetical protein